MKKFDMSSAWDDAMQLVRWESALTLPIVGILILLPQLAFAILGPIPVEPPPDASVSVIMEMLRADIAQMAPYILLLSLLSTLAGVALMRLWLAPGGTSVAEALELAPDEGVG